jgi:hypothetical protein
LLTYRTSRFGFRESLGCSSFSRSAASFTALGIVQELLFAKEQLFVGCENKIGAAVFAGQSPIYVNVSFEHARLSFHAFIAAGNRLSEKRIYDCFHNFISQKTKEPPACCLEGGSERTARCGG